MRPINFSSTILMSSKNNVWNTIVPVEINKKLSFFWVWLSSAQLVWGYCIFNYPLLHEIFIGNELLCKSLNLKNVIYKVNMLYLNLLTNLLIWISLCQAKSNIAPAILSPSGFDSAQLSLFRWNESQYKAA